MKQKPLETPTPKMVEDYAATINYVINGEKFCDYYTATNWMVKKNGKYEKMKNWKLAVNAWKEGDKRRKGRYPRPDAPVTAEQLIKDFESSRGTGG